MPDLESELQNKISPRIICSTIWTFFPWRKVFRLMTKVAIIPSIRSICLLLVSCAQWKINIQVAQYAFSINGGSLPLWLFVSCETFEERKKRTCVILIGVTYMLQRVGRIIYVYCNFLAPVFYYYHYITIQSRNSPSWPHLVKPGVLVLFPPNLDPKPFRLQWILVDIYCKHKA